MSLWQHSLDLWPHPCSDQSTVELLHQYGTNNPRFLCILSAPMTELLASEICLFDDPPSVREISYLNSVR